LKNSLAEQIAVWQRLNRGGIKKLSVRKKSDKQSLFLMEHFQTDGSVHFFEQKFKQKMQNKVCLSSNVHKRRTGSSRALLNHFTSD